jgi:hypothetical protein
MTNSKVSCLSLTISTLFGRKEDCKLNQSGWWWNIAHNTSTGNTRLRLTEKHNEYKLNILLVETYYQENADLYTQVTSLHVYTMVFLGFWSTHAIFRVLAEEATAVHSPLLPDWGLALAILSKGGGLSWGFERHFHYQRINEPQNNHVYTSLYSFDDWIAPNKLSSDLFIFSLKRNRVLPVLVISTMFYVRPSSRLIKLKKGFLLKSNNIKLTWS